jgi:hypothetical protein
LDQFRDDFIDALRRLAAVFEAYRRVVGQRPVLVGGAAVCIYTSGLIASGDFDIVAEADDVLERTLLAAGFRREDRTTHLLVGFYHPDLPAIGVQQISGRLFDGRTDEKRLTLIAMDGDNHVALPPIEDMIADRLGQFAASRDRDAEMLEQARLLFQLAEKLDGKYLRRRIVEEMGDPMHLGL